MSYGVVLPGTAAAEVIATLCDGDLLLTARELVASARATAVIVPEDEPLPDLAVIPLGRPLADASTLGPVNYLTLDMPHRVPGVRREPRVRTIEVDR